MAKSTTNVVRTEAWTVRDGNKSVTIKKVAVRNHLGQFHGATNFKGSVLGK